MSTVVVLTRKLLRTSRLPFPPFPFPQQRLGPFDTQDSISGPGALFIIFLNHFQYVVGIASWKCL